MNSFDSQMVFPVVFFLLAGFLFFVDDWKMLELFNRRISCQMQSCVFHFINKTNLD